MDSGAIPAYERAGAPISAFRLRLARASDDAARRPIRAGLIALVRSDAGSDVSREAIQMVDRTFKERTAAEELAIARTAARIGMTGRAAIAYDKAGDRLFITGKLWKKLYEIKVSVR